MTPIKSLTTCAAILALSAPFASADEAFTMDYAAAKATATEAGKDLFLEFTGSDWCPPCMALNREVFSQEAFQTAAKEHFVLVKLDFPRNNTDHITPEIKAQNDELSTKYGIEGYPTVLLCDAQGRPYAATGYRDGGVEPYLTHLTELRAKRNERDEAFKTAMEAEGPAKATALIAVLEGMEFELPVIAAFYGDIIEVIKASDPADSSGFVTKIQVEESLSTFKQQINALAEEDKFEEILPVIDEALKTEGLTPEQKQEIAIARVLVYAQIERFDESLKALDEAAALAPESEAAGFLEHIKGQLIQARDAQAAGGEEAPEGE